MLTLSTERLRSAMRMIASLSKLTRIGPVAPAGTVRRYGDQVVFDTVTVPSTLAAGTYPNQPAPLRSVGWMPLLSPG